MNLNDTIELICSKGKITEKMEYLKKNDFFRRDFCEKRELYSTGNFSDIVSCDRKVVLRRLSPKNEPSMLNENSDYSEQKQMEFTREKWFSIFKESPKIKLIDKEVLLVDKNVSLHGLLDCAIKIGDLVLTTNIYSLNEEDYCKIKSNGAFRKDIIYMLLCMCFSDTPRGLIVYENRSTLENEFFEVKPDKILLNYIFKESKKINEYVSKQQIPEKPYKELSKECQKCFFKDDCWKTKGDK